MHPLHCGLLPQLVLVKAQIPEEPRKVNLPDHKLKPNFQIILTKLLKQSYFSMVTNLYSLQHLDAFVNTKSILPLF